MNWSKGFIDHLNKAVGTKTFFNLTKDDSGSSANITGWVSTGSRLLDLICSGRINGGLPEGRIIEIYGKTGIGKSHIGYQISKSALDNGGAVMYADSEYATTIENLWNLGIYTKDEERNSRFAWCEPQCLEEVFDNLKAFCEYAAEARKKDPKLKFVFIWDSVAASPSKEELEADYDDKKPALTARSLSKNLKKFVGLVAKTGVIVVCLNQVREKIGIMFGNNETTTGGRALPFYSSIRISLQGGSQITDSDGNTIGINIKAKTVKNKIVSPFRSADFEIHFGVGIKDSEQVFDVLRESGEFEKGEDKFLIEGKGQWKSLIKNGKELKKFRKKEFADLLDSSEYKQILDDYLQYAMSKKVIGHKPDIDVNNYEEVNQLINDSSDLIDPEKDD